MDSSKKIKKLENQLKRYESIIDRLETEISTLEYNNNVLKDQLNNKDNLSPEDRTELNARIREGFVDYRAGRSRPFEDVLTDLSKRNGNLS